MSHKNKEGLITTKRFLFSLAVIGAMILVGCGSSQEATQGQQGQQLGAPQEAPKQEKPMDQALTSFIGEKEPQKPAEPAKTEPAPGPKVADLEKQLEDLRTENTSLKQKIVKLEQDNRTLNARIADNDAKLVAEKERADKAEEALKAAPAVKAKATAVEPPEKAGASMSAYEEALKAFNGRRYDDAVAMLQSMLSAGVADDLADNCTYWIGESYYAKKKYKQAAASFQDVMKFKYSEKKGDAEFMLAQSYERMGNKVKAKEAYEKVVKDYPMCKNVKRAKERWAKL